MGLIDDLNKAGSISDFVSLGIAEDIAKDEKRIRDAIKNKAEKFKIFLEAVQRNASAKYDLEEAIKSGGFMLNRIATESKALGVIPADVPSYKSLKKLIEFAERELSKK